MLRRMLIPPVAVALGLAGCSLLPRAGNLPSHKDLRDSAAALLEAKLIVKGECLFADGESGGRWLPIWPAGFVLLNGVLSDESGQVAVLGETVKLAGGEHHDSEFDHSQTMLLVPRPSACGGGQYSALRLGFR